MSRPRRLPGDPPPVPTHPVHRGRLPVLIRTPTLSRGSKWCPQTLYLRPRNGTAADRKTAVASGVECTAYRVSSVRHGERRGSRSPPPSSRSTSSRRLRRASFTRAAMTRAVGVRLRVPLHAEHPPALRRFDGLGEAVADRARGHAQAVADARRSPGGGGTPRGAGLSPMARIARDPGSTVDVVLIAREPADRAAMLLVAEILGQVLAAACRRPATLITCAPRQMPSTGSPRASASRTRASSVASRRGTGSVGVRVRLRAVGVGAEVGAADQYQPVDAIEHAPGIRNERGVGRDQHGDAARALHLLDVVHRHERRRQVPDGPSRGLHGRAEADDRRV